MIKQEFQRIADKEAGKFYFQEENHLLSNGAHTPDLSFLIRMKYKDNEISVLNQTGTSFVGTIIGKLASHIRPIDFELTSISNLANFFLRRKSRFKIRSENEKIKYFLEHNDVLKQLSDIANNTAFTPHITIDNKNGVDRIITKYHLEFEDWTQVIEPMIELYKNLMDEFEKDIAHLSLNSYKQMNREEKSAS